jgi:hypothetical protein
MSPHASPNIFLLRHRHFTAAKAPSSPPTVPAAVARRPNKSPSVPESRSMASLSGLVAGECSDDCGHRPCAEGNPVIGPSVTVQVMVATKPADFRKGMEGFSRIIQLDT